jgi:phage tail sheath protein FI
MHIHINYSQIITMLHWGLFWAFAFGGVIGAWPGVFVQESTLGSVPISLVSFTTGKMVGISARGPLNTPTLITKLAQFASIFGGETSTSYLFDAVRLWFDNAGQNAPLYVLRVAGSGATAASATLTHAVSAVYSLVTGSVTSFTVTVTVGAGSPVTSGSITVSGLTASSLQTTIGALSNVGGGNVTVTGTGPYTITFGGTLAGLAITATITPTGGSGSSISQTTAGSTVNVLQLTTIGPGSSYNYVASPLSGLSVTYNPTLNGGALLIYDGPTLVEQYYGVNVGNYQLSSQQINGQSNLVSIDWLNVTNNPDMTASAVQFLGGTDGAAVTNATYIGANAAVPYTGLWVFSQTNTNYGWTAPGVLMVPGITDEETGQALVLVASESFSLAFIDSTFGNSVAEAIIERDQYADVEGHAVYVYGWQQIPDAFTGALKWVPRSPTRAAHLVASQGTPFGPANVGAGLAYVMRDAVALETDAPGIGMDDVTQGQLSLAQVDVARNFTQEGQGLVSWECYTISTNNLYLFIQVRVILNILSVSIQQGLKQYVFQPIDGQGTTAGEISGSLNSLLWGLWNQGALFGATPSQAFQVVVDTSNLFQLDAGVLAVDVYIKPTPVARQIAVTLYRVPLAFDFSTGQIDVGQISSATQ